MRDLKIRKVTESPLEVAETEILEVLEEVAQLEKQRPRPPEVRAIGIITMIEVKAHVGENRFVNYAKNMDIFVKNVPITHGRNGMRRHHHVGSVKVPMQAHAGRMLL